MRLDILFKAVRDVALLVAGVITFVFMFVIAINIAGNYANGVFWLIGIIIFILFLFARYQELLHRDE